MNKEYKIKLDLNKKIYNKKMTFNQFDENVNDFYIEVTKNNEVVKDLDKSIITLVAIKPNGTVDAQFIEVKEGQIYADLKPSMCDIVGNYQAKAMIALEGKIITTDTIIYSVNEDKIISRLNEDVVSDERFTLFTDALARLSTIELSEEQRQINEAERILAEENRKIEETKRVEAELIRQHEEADRAKYDAIRESNENIRKQNESIRLANETNRIDEEAKRVEEENKRKLAEEERNANYNFMTEDEERRRSEANAHKEAEVLRVQAETNRVNEEAKRRTTEQGRVSAENTRVSNENTREANEEARQSNETKRVEAETQRKSRYNSFISDAEANANNFENYTNTAKVKEEERKSNELERKSQETQRVSNENERLANEETRKANEVVREENETSRQNIFENKVNEVDKKIVEINTTKDNFISSINTKVDNKISELDSAKSDMTNTVSNKVNEVENRFNALTSKQQQDAEVIDARDGEVSLKARLDRDIEKAKQVYVNVEGSHISIDSSVGYAKDIEILGNTIQDASNLADIRSVGDKVEGQELYEISVVSCGKNLFDKNACVDGYILSGVNGETVTASATWFYTDYIKVKAGVTYRLGTYKKPFDPFYSCLYREDKTFIKSNIGEVFTPSENGYVRLSGILEYKHLGQLEEGTVATPYEPYQEDKLTILSPTPLEKVGDVADRVVCKDEVWGVEKNVKTVVFDGTVVNGNVSSNFPSDNSSMFYIVFNDTANDSVLICDKFPNKNISHTSNRNIEGVFTSVNGSNNAFYFRIFNDKLSTQDITGFKQWLSENNVTIKYKTVSPTFIPLPHDQQVKLRTFANKTNISFLTEIEGTIKAQVPKSLGATVNTHTEQISNLNKELDRVKKLEESTVSTVETESDFTTVEATSNGYFEDVKLEGKTLVNLCDLPSGNITLANSYGAGRITPLKQLTSSDTLYLTFNCTSVNTDAHTGIIYCILYKDDTPTEYLVIENHKTVGYKKVKIVPKSDVKNIIIYLHGDNSPSASATISDVMLMYEKDYDVQNPPSYFEGLKSVGQSATTSEDGVDEIVVSSVKGDGNLVNEFIFSGKNSIKNDLGIDIEDDTSAYCENYIRVLPNKTYTLSLSGQQRIYFYDKNKNWIRRTDNNLINVKTFKTPLNCYYIQVQYYKQSLVNGENIVLNLGDTISSDVLKSDKKRLLYYNNETQAWEKPILRQWDSIEKHSNGKYYYHQRSGEVVLNGSEDWKLNTQTQSESVIRFVLDATSIGMAGNRNPVISDKFRLTTNYDVTSNEESIFTSIGGASLFITISKPKLSTQDAQGFKQWLQANNVTVVYQLAKEKVYECTNIDLITYANETNYIVECGAIVPKSTLKVHNNISNVVSLLQKKVSLLESNVKASQEVQDMMILETDMRMLDIELALMEFIPMKLNLLGGRDMLRSATYFNFLKNHIINETYEKEYLENVMNKYLATGRINQDEYDELYKMLYPPVYDIELPIEY